MEAQSTPSDEELKAATTEAEDLQEGTEATEAEEDNEEAEED